MAKKKNATNEGGADLSAPPDGQASANLPLLSNESGPGVPYTGETAEQRAEREARLAQSLADSEREAAALRAEPPPWPQAAPAPRVPVANGQPAKPRSVFMVVAQDEHGDWTEVLGVHKTIRRARAWMKDNGGMLRRHFAALRVYRAREVAP